MSSNNFCFHMWSNVQGWHVWYGVCKVHANDSLELRIIKCTSLYATKKWDKTSRKFSQHVHLYHKRYDIGSSNVLKFTKKSTKCIKKTRNEKYNIVY